MYKMPYILIVRHMGFSLNGFFCPLLVSFLPLWEENWDLYLTTEKTFFLVTAPVVSVHGQQAFGLPWCSTAWWEPQCHTLEMFSTYAYEGHDIHHVLLQSVIRNYNNDFTLVLCFFCMLSFFFKKNPQSVFLNQ